LTINDYTYCDAYPDLEAALDYLIANEYNGKRILWGSSFGTALSIQLTSKRQKDVDALLAFSPSTGNTIQACHPNQYLKDINIPLLSLKNTTIKLILQSMVNTAHPCWSKNV
jgi:alpha/beta superfamily hydrolase